MTRLEQFAALPELVQVQLLRLSRLAAGMSADEKQAARWLISQVTIQCEAQVGDDYVEAVEMVAACGRLVTAFDELAGDQASEWVI